MERLLAILFLMAATWLSFGAESLPRLNNTPQNIEQLWADYDPRCEPIETQVVHEWQEDGLTLRYVIYSIGVFKGKPASMAAFYGFPNGEQKLPA